MSERKIVVPGETIIHGDDFLPGDGTRREGQNILANRYGLAEIDNKLTRVIPLSGAYVPRRGNAIIGKVTNITFRGWLIDYGGANEGFLSVSEVPRYIGKGELRDHFDFGDVVFAKIWGTDGGNLDLSVKMREYGKLTGGQLIEVNPHKVPRIIGKEGSMVHLIKDATNCNVTVGQNGFVWLRAEKLDDEINARKIIEFICDNSYIHGLTEKVEDYIKNELKLEVKVRERRSFNEEESEERFEEEKFSEERN
jgi:exosome complex component RRP4